ncbi:MAG: serine/threonine-protein kinase [Opitutus sp.]
MSTETKDALLARLLELPEGERAEYLKQVCASVPGLWETVRPVLLTPSPTDGTTPVAVPKSDGERVRIMELALDLHESGSETIGPYKLLQKIGEGGFGVVWMAEQQTPVRRRVAVKVIKSGMDTREVIARFEAERQALALMDHPNIARVFDAGSTDLGQPYFVMELVRGIPITRYCDDHRLSTQQRLHLFIAVCHAVQHAHQKGIIHRDLKPSNIIVTLHDGVPMPKIIDFGIAKATESRLTDKTLFTQFHAFLGTPAYTSPEQMEMSGLDVDTRSDIYSLGVLLYELLAGQPPFDPDTLVKSGLEAMRHTIREIDPPRPSQRVRTLSGEVGTTVGLRRGMTATKLSVLLRGDLDWIVMHCLEKDRTRRYETANNLAADVRRYLTDEPVLARPPTAAYQFKKFFRRHRVGFIAGGAVLASLLAALVIASVSLVRQRAARAREAALRAEADVHTQQARTAAEKSAEVARFMTEMLSGVGPSVALGRDTTMLREVLDRTERRLNSELQGEPSVIADLRATLGQVYRDIGLYAAAEPLLRAVVAHRRQSPDMTSGELSTSLDRLGEILLRLNKPVEAENCLREALALRRQSDGDDSLPVAETLFHLSQLPLSRQTPAESENLLLQVLAIRRQHLGAEHILIADATAALGTAARGRLEHDRAAVLHAEALAMYRRLLGNEHPAVATALDSLGFSLMHLGRKAEAKEAYRESFFLRRKLLGAQHPQLVVALLRYFSQISTAEADADVIALVRDFIAAQRKVLPNGSPLLGPPLLILASLLDSPARDQAASIELVREARDLFHRSIASGPSIDVEVLNTMSLFGWGKFVTGHASEGRLMTEEGLTLSRNAFGQTHTGLILPNRILAWVYLGMRHYAEAIPQFEEAIRVDRATLPATHAFIGMDVTGLGTAYCGARRFSDARRVLELGIATENDWAKAGKAGSGSRPLMLSELGRTLTQQGLFTEAESAFRASLRQYTGEHSNPLLLLIRPPCWTQVGLGTALCGETRYAEAEPLLLAAFEELSSRESSYCGDARAMVTDSYNAVIALYSAWGKPDAVQRWQARKPSI